MSEVASKFIWYELMTSDAAAAATFYGAVVGWSSADAGHPTLRYTLLKVGDIPVGGVVEMPQEARAAGAQPGWIGHIWVADVDAAAAEITAAGGSIHRGPEDIPQIGRFAAAADPDGAKFLVFHPTGMAPAEPVPGGTPGHIGWHELRAVDPVRAFDFYAGLFGWTRADAIDMGPMGIYQIFAIAGVGTGGMMTKTPDEPASSWVYYINVDDIDAAAARVSGNGGRVLHGPQQVPGGSWILNCLDPQGAVFALVSSPR